MDRTYIAVLIASVGATLQPSFPGLAHAEGLPGPTHAEGSPRVRYALVADHFNHPMLGILGTQTALLYETPAPSVPRECTPKYMVGPGMGIALGPSAVVGGTFMVALGSFDLFDTDPKTAGDKGLIAGGSLLMAAGLGTFLYSIGKLVKNRRTRRSVCSPPEETVSDQST